MLELIQILIEALWLMLPAYIANPSAVVFGGGTPVDFGKNWSDGRRILGDGKTIRGLLGGTACGIIIGLIQMHISTMWLPANFTFKNFTLISIITLSFGALLGDMVKSFFKRRAGYVRGAKLPLIDQLDFVAGAWILTYIFEPQWFTENFTLQIMITVLILTPVFHRLTNIIGYYIKVKKEPW